MVGCPFFVAFLTLVSFESFLDGRTKISVTVQQAQIGNFTLTSDIKIVDCLAEPVGSSGTDGGDKTENTVAAIRLIINQRDRRFACFFGTVGNSLELIKNFTVHSIDVASSKD